MKRVVMVGKIERRDGTTTMVIKIANSRGGISTALTLQPIQKKDDNERHSNGHSNPAV